MCTGIRFVDDQNHLYFGRNLDIGYEYGEKVIVAPRNFHFPMLYIDDIEVSQAIIGMGIVASGLPLYFDAANEAGLCIAGLNFPGNAYFYDDIEEGKINITPTEFMIWTLSNFNCVADVKKELKKVRLINKPVPVDVPIAPLHWIISDDEASIVVEQTIDGLHIYDNSVDVLTNNPYFPWHLTNLNNYIGINHQDKQPTQWNKQKIEAFGVGSGSIGLPGDSTPPSRFVRAAYALYSYPPVKGEVANVTKLFNILNNVAMPLGTVTNLMSEKEFTVYSSCYSVASKTYYYRRYNDYHVIECALTDANIQSDNLNIFD